MQNLKFEIWKSQKLEDRKQRNKLDIWVEIHANIYTKPAGITTEEFKQRL